MGKRSFSFLVYLCLACNASGMQGAGSMNTPSQPVTTDPPALGGSLGNNLAKPVTMQTAAYQSYNYLGDRYRDPFIPLVGQALSDQSSDRPPQITSLELKGIIEDAKGRLALLTSGVSSYLLKGGRLYDGRNHMMRGISGVVKPSSVILIGSDHTVRELQLKVTL
jgi:hypothetical protein